jgi:DNA-binding Lrp family transcriptional regulator
LYRGYKKRNAQLDVLSEKPPPYLASKKVSVAVHDFADVEDEATLRSIHDYVFRRYNLLDRVIRARRLHHSHFFAIDNDYGHEKYLDRLQNERHVMVKALEKLGKRAAALMHQQKQWYDWVKKAQDDEEQTGETEGKKVKLEALLFKRHQKEIARHQREMRSKEDKKRQEEYLNQVYEQRLSDMSEEEQDDWDPIQDVYGYEKDNYVDLIKFFLMLEDDAPSGEDATLPALVEADAAESYNPGDKALSKSAKKRARKANAEVKKMADPTLQTAEGRGSNVIEMETKQQMRERLRQPVKFERSKGWYMAGSGPLGIDAKTPVLPEDEVEQLLEEVAEIKNLIFCRLLLAQATLLPIALGSDSIDEFLQRSEVTREHLRDLCLKLERPGLQDVRDACADFIRERDGVEEEDTDTPSDGEDDEDEGQVPRKYRLVPKHRDELPGKYQTKREKAAKKAKKPPPELGDNTEDGVLDFGKITDEDQYSRKRMRIKVCGRYMYHYPSEKALNRGGWYHFSVIAKDSDLFDAIELCRNWNEFFELNILCLHHYFPAPKWSRFVGDFPRQQLLQLGFIPYFNGENAEKVTSYFQTGSRGTARRSHAVTEMRNFICGHIKRDDPASRRFIQYLSNETWEIRALVRDRKTGRILIQPPKDEMWLLRGKSGWGRANKNDFDVIGEIGPDFFEQMVSV